MHHFPFSSSKSEVYNTLINYEMTVCKRRKKGIPASFNYMPVSRALCSLLFPWSINALRSQIRVPPFNAQNMNLVDNE